MAFVQLVKLFGAHGFKLLFSVVVLHLPQDLIRSILLHQLLSSGVRRKVAIEGSHQKVTLGVGAHADVLLGSFVKKVGKVIVGIALFRLLSKGPVKEFSVCVCVLRHNNKKGLFIDDISSGILVGIDLDNNLLLVAGSCVERIVPNGVNVSNVGGDSL